jgi:hypothetical protein
VIAGQNPYPSQVNGSMVGAPWFFPGVIQVESSYPQFDPATSDKPIFGPRHGFGLAQLDPPPDYADYWDWIANLEDGVTHTNGDFQSAQAEWNYQINRMVQETNGNPQWPGPNCSSNTQCSFAPGTYCAPGFDSEPPNGSPGNGYHSFIHANWIYMYNHGAPSVFIWWDAGAWHTDTTPPAYLLGVCGATPPQAP